MTIRYMLVVFLSIRDHIGTWVNNDMGTLVYGYIGNNDIGTLI